MKVGDIVICINSTHLGLTYGKQYEILIYPTKKIESFGRTIINFGIIDDKDRQIFVNPRRFISLSEWREMKLGELGI